MRRARGAAGAGRQVVIAACLLLLACQGAAGPGPGVLAGRVVDQADRPAEGLALGLSCGTRAGTVAFYKLETDSDGGYAVRAEDCQEEVEGRLRIEYRGEEWLLRLHPTDGTTDETESTEGAVEDFQWRISGQMPEGDPEDPRDYYGGHAHVLYTEEGGVRERIPMPFPEQSVVRFTWKPLEPLIDGSPGSVLRFSRTVGAINSGKYRFSTADLHHEGPIEQSDALHDIPPGVYEVSAMLTEPGGREVPIRLQTLGGQKYQERVRVELAPSLPYQEENGIDLTVLFIRE